MKRAVLPIERRGAEGLVANNEDLYACLMRGFRPRICGDESVHELYAKLLSLGGRLYGEGVSGYEYVRRINNYFAIAVRYDYAAAHDAGAHPLSYDFVAPLLENKCVCAGSAKLFGLLCALALIPSVIVVGRWRQGEALHAWNKVRLSLPQGEGWFNVDMTAAVPISSRVSARGKFFLISDREAEKTHIFLPNTLLPRYYRFNEYAGICGAGYPEADIELDAREKG